MNLIGLEGEGIKEIAEVARIEDRNHFEARVPRIYELGGKLPASMVDLRHFGVSACCAVGGPDRHQGDVDGAGGSRAMRRARLYPHLQHDGGQGSSHRRIVAGDSQRVSRARIVVLGIPGRGAVRPLYAAR